MPERFDKFTTRAREVLRRAQGESQRLGSNRIDTEHLLLGLLHAPGSTGCRALAAMTEVSKLAAATEVLARHSGDAALGLSSHSKRVLEYSVEEARRLNHSYIGTEHLLLGMLREGKGIAYQTMSSAGVTIERARTEVARILATESQRPLIENARIVLGEFDTGPGQTTDLGALRAAPSTDLAIAALRALYKAKTDLESINQDTLSRALLQGLVVDEIMLAINLLGLQTFNHQELEDTVRRLRQAIDLLNKTALALQPVHLEASVSLATASAAVQLALVR